MMPASSRTLPRDRSRSLASVTPPRISVAIPLHDEEDVFPELVERVAAVLDARRPWVGVPQVGTPVERDRRAAGEPGDTTRLVRLAFDRIFSVTSLRAAWILGAVASVAASIYALWAIFERLFLATSPQGFTALIVAITFVAGIRLLFLGLIGEYLGSVYDEAKSRPQYIITEVVRTTTRTTSRPCR